MNDIKFDFNNMMSFNVGEKNGITGKDLSDIDGVLKKSFEHLTNVLKSESNRIALNLEWTALPFQDAQEINAIQKLGDEIAKKYESVLSLGIGGSYLGLKAAQDALCSPYYNEFKKARNGRAKIYFEGNNLDPTPIKALLKNLNPKKTFVIVISKSGETTETKAVFEVVEEWLKKSVGEKYGRQIFAITDPKSGSLRRRVDEEQKRDVLSFRNLSLLQGVGGRFSEFNMGLMHLAIVGIKIKEVLDGARKMHERCTNEDIKKNPALLYAALHFLAHKKGRPIAILMPFTELLKSTADWYCQLLAESTGKKFARKIIAKGPGLEHWVIDPQRIVNAGRTPIPSRGTTDLHSIQQNNVEGENNKTITMIRVETFKDDIYVPKSEGILSSQPFSKLLSLACEATEWALTRNERPSCTITLKELNPSTWGGLLYFFEMATAYEGELLSINAFDQPGVESYKNYMYLKLRKPGISAEVAREIEEHPVVKKQEFILDQ